MKKFGAIYSKELKYYFTSVTAYVAITVFLVLSGYFFFSIFRVYNLLSLQAIKNNDFSGNLNLIDGVMRPLMGNISVILLILLPLLTMRLLAEERKQGTFELLLTYPVTDFAVVAGKYFAALTVYAVMLASTFLYPILLLIFTDPEIIPLMAGYLGLFLMGASFISIGTFFSSTTSNQMVAGVMTFGLTLLFLIIGWTAPFAGPTVSAILSEFSILFHLDSFTKGIIDTRDISYYLFMSGFFFFLTLKSLESNRWKI
ncbi:MAG: ABC transporter permease [Bacteroidales bacterium]|nr:ABC transporter permease [Candidatus Latescibacterota bacterium]